MCPVKMAGVHLCLDSCVLIMSVLRINLRLLKTRDHGNSLILSACHRGHQHHGVAVCQRTSFVCAASVDENDASGQFVLGNTAIRQQRQQLFNVLSVQLFFFDAGLNQEHTVEFYRNHLIFKRRRVASVGMPFLSQPRAA